MATEKLNPPFTDTDSFYRAVNPTDAKHFKANKVKPRAFAPKPNKGLSVDWAALTTASESAQRQAHRWDYVPTPVAEITGVLVLEIGLNVRRASMPSNDSHCEMYGDLLNYNPSHPEGTSARQRLANECTMLGPFGVTYI